MGVAGLVAVEMSGGGVVSIILWADVLHLVNGAALWAALDWALTGHLRGVSLRSAICGLGRFRAQRPENGRELTVNQMVTWESAGEPVHPAYCSSPKDLTMIGSATVPRVYQQISSTETLQTSSEPRLAQCALRRKVWGLCTGAGSIEWLHVEDINAVHLSKDLKTLKTGGLLDIGWDGSDWGSWWHKVGLALDIWFMVSAAPWQRQLSA